MNTRMYIVHFGEFGTLGASTTEAYLLIPLALGKREDARRIHLITETLDLFIKFQLRRGFR